MFGSDEEGVEYGKPDPNIYGSETGLSAVEGTMWSLYPSQDNPILHALQHHLLHQTIFHVVDEPQQGLGHICCAVPALPAHRDWRRFPKVPAVETNLGWFAVGCSLEGATAPTEN